MIQSESGKAPSSTQRGWKDLLNISWLRELELQIEISPNIRPLHSPLPPSLANSPMLAMKKYNLLEE